MEKVELPSVSFIIPTLNSERTLRDCLTSIKIQNYPKEKVEVLLIDGGSKDSTETIAKKFGYNFISGGYKNNQEARKGVGLSYAKKELVAYIDSDNILSNYNWLKQMVKPFTDNKKIVCAETWKYGIKSSFGYLNRYFALTGVNDPLALYLRKNDKLPWTYSNWTIGKILEDNQTYTLVEFTKDNLPTVGANGFLARRDILLKAKCDPKNFFHIDVVVDMIDQGYNTFAIVKNEIYHNTATTLLKLASRRMSYFKVHNPSHSNRRYLLFNPKKPRDLVNIALYIIYTITFIEPIFFALRGFRKKPDFAWFLHPIVCFLFLMSYSVAFLSLLISRVLKRQS